MVAAAPECRKGHSLVRIDHPNLLQSWRSHACNDCGRSIASEAARFHCSSCEAEVCFRCILRIWKPKAKTVLAMKRRSHGNQSSSRIPHLWKQISLKYEAPHSRESHKVRGIYHATLCPLANWVLYDPDDPGRKADFQKRPIRSDGYVCRMRPLHTPRQGPEAPACREPSRHPRRARQHHRSGGIESIGRYGVSDSDSSVDSEEDLNWRPKHHSHVESAIECIGGQDLLPRCGQAHVGSVEVKSDRESLVAETSPLALPNLLPTWKEVRVDLAEVKGGRGERQLEKTWQPEPLAKELPILPPPSRFSYAKPLEQDRMLVDIDSFLSGSLQSNAQQIRNMHIDLESGECAPKSFLICYPSEAHLCEC